MIKNIALRVDADNDIGLGHLIRIKGFIYRNISSYKKFILITKTSKILIKKNFHHQKIKTYFLSKKNYTNNNYILKILKSENCDLLLSDISYKKNLLKKNFLKKYHNYFLKKKIFSVSIDDPRQYICSSVSIVPYPIKINSLKKNKKSKLFHGIKYICFNKSLKKNKKKVKKIPKNILIALSGYDPNNQSMKILKSILKLNVELKIKVICDKKYNLQYLKLSKNIKNKLVLINEIKNINTLLNWSDIVVTGEGLLRFEAAVKGVPSIFLNNVENSKKNTELINEFLKLQTSLFFKFSNFKLISFRSTFIKFYKNYKLRKIYSINGKTKLDLSGAKKVSNIIFKYYLK